MKSGKIKRYGWRLPLTPPTLSPDPIPAYATGIAVIAVMSGWSLDCGKTQMIRSIPA